MRNPVVSDKFYTGDPVKLGNQVSNLLQDVSDQNVDIAIVPHAGYIYCGKCMGRIYSMLGGDVDTVILLGPNHRGVGKEISFSFQNFLMPLGKVEVDLTLGKNILEDAKKLKLDVGEDEKAHNYEHSLEVQLPFLQTIMKKAKIMPIILKSLSYENCLKLAKVIYSSIQKSNKKVKIILSSDFTHYGEIYNFTPFKENIKENLYELDKKAVDYILNFDSKEFYDYATKNTTICGIFAITIGIELAKYFKCKTAEKICYFTSGDFMQDYSTSVNYAGVIFK